MVRGCLVHYKPFLVDVVEWLHSTLVNISIVYSLVLSSFVDSLWVDPLWRRANARNVSLETLYIGHFKLSTQLMKTNNRLVNLPHLRSATVSLEIYPLYSLLWLALFDMCFPQWSPFARAPVVVLLDRGYPCFWNVYFILFFSRWRITTASKIQDSCSYFDAKK